MTSSPQLKQVMPGRALASPTVQPAGASRRVRPATVPSRFRSPAVSGQASELASTAALVALVAMLTAVLVALVVHCFFGSAVRRALGLTFTGLPARTLNEWWSVFSWNLRHLIAPLAAAGLVWLRGPRPSRLSLCFETVIGLFVLEQVAVNALYVGMALGAYGLRTTWWLAPHGPVELAAYATALAIWVQALRGRLPLRLGLHGAAVSVLLLAAAAAIETGLR